MNEFLNPLAPQDGNTSNASNASNASLAARDTMQLLKNTAKAVKHLKSLVNALQHTLVRVQAKAAPVSTVSLDVEDHLSLAFSFQHGGSECAGNAWESCVQEMYCFGLPAEVAPGCVADHGRNKMNLAALHQCVFGNTHFKGLQVPRSTILLM
jgi:hypothetical protein